MASIPQEVMVVRPAGAITGRNGLIDKYFYFAMSLMIAAIVGSGFSQTVNEHCSTPPSRDPQSCGFTARRFSGRIAPI